MEDAFTFAVLDDISMVDPTETDSILGDLRGMSWRALGPFVEYSLLGRSTLRHLPELKDVAPASLCHLWTSSTDDLSLNARDSELVRIPSDSTERTPYWIAFLKRLERAAKSAGLASSVSAGLAGAALELAENVLLHSDLPSSGVLGYRAERGLFEYVVADSGIGVRRSLQKSDTYSHLLDDSAALTLALQDGVSRFASDPGHGFGFRSVFQPLQSVFGNLRFRSGEAAFSISAASPRREAGRAAQHPLYRGVLVSVEIRA